MENQFESSFNQVKNSILKYFMLFWVLTGVGLAVYPILPKAVAGFIFISVLAILAIQLISSFFTEALLGNKYINMYVSFGYGVVFYELIQKYVSAMGGDVVLAVVFSATVLFLIMGIIGMKTKKDLSGMYAYLFGICLALCIASLIGVLLGLSFMMIVISAISLVLFSIFTIVEFNMIQKGYASKKDAHVWGYNLYLNLLNMILDLLRLAYAIFGDD